MWTVRVFACLILAAACLPTAIHAEEDDSSLRVSIGAQEAVFRLVSPATERVAYPNYYLLETEVTNAQFKAFLTDTGRVKDDTDIIAILKRRAESHTFSTGDIPYRVEDPSAVWKKGEFPAGEGDHPVCFVTLDDAQDSCQWLEQKHPRLGHFRLPTWNEWMYAAYGRSRNYPWGNVWKKSLLHASYGMKYETAARPRRTEKVKSRPDGRTPQGLFGMLGNASELITEGDMTSEDYFHLGSRWMGDGFTDGLELVGASTPAAEPRNDYWGYSHSSQLRQCDVGFRVLLDPSRDKSLLKRPRLFDQTNRARLVEEDEDLEHFQ